MAIILALQINPEISLILPVSFENQLFVFFIAVITALAFIEAGGLHKENRGSGGGRFSPSGFTFAVIVALVMAFIGLGLSVFVIITDYSYNDSEINTWISYYLATGALMIFILSREDIFLHKAILSKWNR